MHCSQSPHLDQNKCTAWLWPHLPGVELFFQRKNIDIGRTRRIKGTTSRWSLPPNAAIDMGRKRHDSKVRKHALARVH